MKVICFVGKEDSGKSRIINRILNKFFKIILINLVPKQKKKDFCIIFMYKRKKIGICNRGDDPSILKILRKLRIEGCEIIICASRTKGGLFEEIKKMYNKKDIKWIDCFGKRTSSKGFKVKENKKRIRDFKRIFNKLI
jgi:hypothetical protein